MAKLTAFRTPDRALTKEELRIQRGHVCADEIPSQQTIWTSKRWWNKRKRPPIVVGTEITCSCGKVFVLGYF